MWDALTNWLFPPPDYTLSHQWSPWEVIDAKEHAGPVGVFFSGYGGMQRRQCLSCGLTQEAHLGAISLIQCHGVVLKVE